MGYEINHLAVSGRLSNHNDERDDEHRQLWDELTERIRQLIEDPRYADIEPDLSA